ncbi:hypothetical protein TZ00_09160 [Agreia bicolorata]|uniref:WXG100 family type VII secretion target n=1 Tax=Agreia bicolorata TaxID=110935 RepID=A0ABR5CFU7_9MICO|nr:hypothetical protein TZ00_09160 [Agreia bicolorata]
MTTELGVDTGAVTDHPNPLLTHVSEALEHDRVAVQRLSVELCAELLPTFMRDDAPGWQGIARRSFDTRCEHVAADVRRVSSTLDEIAGALAGAIERIGSTP